MKREKIRIHELEPDTEKELIINSRHRYSAERIKLDAGCLYHVFCKEDQRWWDFLIPTSPKGYPKGPANILGTRVKGAPIFSLCASVLPATGEENDDDVFRVKTEAQPHELTYDTERILCFFANDTKGWEWNNFGSIIIVVKKVAR